MDNLNRQQIFEDLTFCVLTATENRESLDTDIDARNVWLTKNAYVQETVKHLSTEDLKWLNDKYTLWCKANNIPNAHRLTENYRHPALEKT